MKIYFAGSIRGGRADAGLYSRMISYIQKTDTVLTEHIGFPDLKESETDKGIYERDIAWLKEADLVIGECTNPSLGVGYELAYAEKLGKPCHIFYDSGKTNLSAMLTGDSWFYIHPYVREEDIYPALDRILKAPVYRFYGWRTADITDSRGLTPRDMYSLLARVWAADTCAPRMRAGWSEENRTLGQCSVTAFLMQDIYGGKVYGIPLAEGGWHCFNVAGGCVFDLTSEQFGDEALDYANCTEQSRQEHFSKEEKRLRYELLRERLAKAIASGRTDG